jgi:hypothetical protein
MSTGATCLNCGASLLPTEFAAARCARCASNLPTRFEANAITAEPPRAALGVTDHLPADHSDRRATDHGPLTVAERWRGMRRGVMLVHWGVVFTVIALLIQCLSVSFLYSGVFPVGLMVMLIAAGVTLIGSVVYVIGFLMYCTIPAESGGRGWAIAGLGCLLATVAAVVVFMFIPFPTHSSPRRAEIVLDAFLLACLVGIVILMFITSLAYTLVMRAAARYWGDQALANSFLNFFLVSSAGSVALVLFVLCLGNFERSLPYDFPMFLGCGLLIVALIMTCWFLNLLGRLLDVIPETEA